MRQFVVAFQMNNKSASLFDMKLLPFNLRHLMWNLQLAIWWSAIAGWNSALREI